MAVLTIIEVPDGGVPTRHRLRGPRVRIGRDADNDVVLADPLVSRTHLELRLDDGCWLVSDAGSKHGSSLNGRPLKGWEPLRSGFQLRVGGCTLVAEIDDVSSAAPVGLTADHPPGSAPDAGIAQLVGSSEAIRAVRDRVRKLAASDLTVLVTGETGTGKELVARLLHQWSARAAGPFVIVHSAELQPTLFESELFGVAPRALSDVAEREGHARLADKGTLFLDEIGELHPDCQAKMLRFLQDRTVQPIGGKGRERVDVRLVAATNRDLEAEVAAGRFRSDLYHRLRAAHVQLPAWRAHREDLSELVTWLLPHLTPRPSGIAPDALAKLAVAPLPGNVRELESALREAAVDAGGGVLEASHLRRSSAVSPADGIEDLAARLLDGRAGFETDVAEPYKARSLSTEDARALFRILLAGTTMTALARRLGVEPKRLMGFLEHYELRPGDEP